MSERSEQIRAYFRKQYESQEGATADNVNELFAPDLVYHLSEERAIGREDLIALTDMLRRTRHERTPEVSGFEEDGDDVSFTMSIAGRDPDSSTDVQVNSRTTYRFRGNRVIDVWQDSPRGLEDAVQAAGVDIG